MVYGPPMRALWIVAVLFACKDIENDWVLKDAKKSIAKLEAEVKHPTIKAAIVECAKMANIDVLDKQDHAVADRLRQLCTKDIQIAIMNAQLDAIEAKKRATATPDELAIECIDPFYENAKK